ncbi:TRM8 [Candida jiufengensis]|uniref:TRM8 n=1 Tax=Candida jiufengensis TaxID=497108 RepID=UPI002224E962|nr:TRM8 [Candida jiufengensis]KAI5950940.1 TRM8 [Candida jiufengensis]
MQNHWVQITCLILLTLWIKYRTTSFLTLIGGVVFTIIGYIYISIRFTTTNNINKKQKYSRFKFSQRKIWEVELKHFEQEKHEPNIDTIAPTNSEKLINLFDLIIDEFINSWYRQITTSDLFTNDIKNELIQITNKTVSRLKKIDLAKLIVTKLLPIFNNQFIEFSKVKKFSINQNNLVKDDAELLASFSDGILHAGVSMIDSDNSEKNYNEKIYLRKLVGKLLSILLSEKEQSNEISKIFLTEILACTALDNVFNLLSEGDFYNLMIVKVIGDSLRRRDQVKELRAVLEQHSLSSGLDQSAMEKLDELLDDDTKPNDTVVYRDGAELLEAILKSPIKLKEFSDFLKSSNKIHLLNFWQMIEEIKSPLDDASVNSNTAGDVDKIKSTFFDTNLIQIDPEDLKDLKVDKTSKIVLYKIQSQVFDNLKSYYPEFIASRYNQTKKDSKDDVLASIENTFTNIMNSNSNHQTEIGLNEKINSDRYSKLFEDDMSEASDEEDGEEEEEDTSDTDESFVEKGSESVEFAAPGNLNLAEEIPRVEQEIERLKQQLTYLEPLLNKAEITNNSSKFKVLQKSKIGVQKDLQLKELQLQQYIIQENDNSLFGKSRVAIESLVNGSENGKEFILYIIEVQKFSSENPDIIKAGWVVARRYSQFHRLNGYLKRRYPQVLNLNFPKKSISVLKFQQKNIIDNRKYLLEVYLRNLVKIPEVCSDKAFRSFLSSENFHLRKFKYKFEDHQPKRISTFFSKNWYGLSNKSTTQHQTNEELLENKRIMEKELRQFDENKNSNSSSTVSLSNLQPTKQSFVKPICDLLITVFNLHWLKGRALVVILQQVFGTAIEKRVYDFISSQTDSSKIDEILTLLTNLLFPNGKFKDPPELRSNLQKLKTANEAKLLFNRYMNETYSKLFGTENTIFASNILFNMIQIDQLNKHLLFQVLDQIMNEICK